MARYIDADLLIKNIANIEDLRTLSTKTIGKAISDTPTADVVEVVRCKDCKHLQELDKHCEINRSAYRHCNMWRGEEEKNVWHSYKKYRKDYSIVELDGFCDMGERRDT